MSCLDPESFVRGGPTLTFFVFFFHVFFQWMRGERIQIQIISGHHRLTSKGPFQWRFAGGPMLAQH